MAVVISATQLSPNALGDSPPGEARSNTHRGRATPLLNLAPREPTPQPRLVLDTRRATRNQTPPPAVLVVVQDGRSGHDRLFLEEPELERYGRAVSGPVQTLKSSIRFFMRAPFVPSKLYLLPITRRR